jgi:fructoselysine-6-P-deglycase FrlB-like protein
MVVEAEIAKLRKFQEFLRTEDKLVFQDLLNQCKLYAPYASTMASTIKEVPLFISMLFGQHKRIIELEKKILMLETLATKTEATVPGQALHGPVEKLEPKIV